MLPFLVLVKAVDIGTALIFNGLFQTSTGFTGLLQSGLITGLFFLLIWLWTKLTPPKLRMYSGIVAIPFLFSLFYNPLIFMLFLFGAGFYSFIIYQGELYELIEKKFGISIYTNLALSLFASGSFFLWNKLYPSENPEYTYAILLIQGLFSFLASYWRKRTNFEYRPTGREPGWFFVIAFAAAAGLIQYLERMGYFPGGSTVITYFSLCFYGFAAFMAYIQLIVAASRLKPRTGVL